MKSELQTKLDENIPKDVVSTREQAGRSLSYLETWYVIDRLNQVLGQGKWGYRIEKLERVYEGTIAQSSGEAFTTSYVAQIALDASIDGQVVRFMEVGYGDGADRKSKGKAHELATKEAVSDALKRAAKNLGRSMGLALYDKTQEFVGKPETADLPTKSDTTDTSEGNGIGNRNEVSHNSSKHTPGSVENAKPKTTPVKELITQAFKVLEAQKKITKEEFKTKYQKGAGLSSLSEPTLQFILSSLKTDFPHLGL